MFQAALRSARPAALVSRSLRASSSPALRALSTTALRRSDDHHAAAPAIFGVGAKPGEVPTDEAQSTGLDRIQTLGHLEGVEVFDLEPLDASRVGTLADPIKVFSVEPDRIVGCTGFPADSHDLLWFNVTTEKPQRCTECGSAYAIDYNPDTAVVTEVAPQHEHEAAHAH
ncbi:COX5B-domain-containing protein [Artomyces pyxidatus]|uniref:COX5B-domain-containing protein n=1 Tax=Artomyces pyxidatus TaxID=48021 RepID=A0ACB8T7J3_9AGAM|nr:COX5B-domain-containing protein [Artomyces pyxidatus]